MKMHIEFTATEKSAIDSLVCKFGETVIWDTYSKKSKSGNFSETVNPDGSITTDYEVKEDLTIETIKVIGEFSDIIIGAIRTIKTMVGGLKQRFEKWIDKDYEVVAADHFEKNPEDKHLLMCGEKRFTDSGKVKTHWTVAAIQNPDMDTIKAMLAEIHFGINYDTLIVASMGCDDTITYKTVEELLLESLR